MLCKFFFRLRNRRSDTTHRRRTDNASGWQKPTTTTLPLIISYLPTEAMFRDWLHTTTCSYSLSIINYDYDYYHLPLRWPPHHCRAHTQFYYQNYIRPTENRILCHDDIISFNRFMLCFACPNSRLVWPFRADTVTPATLVSGRIFLLRTWCLSAWYYLKYTIIR